MLGRSMAKITEDEGMPSEATVYSWLSDGASGVEPFTEFLERYNAARAIQAEKHMDSIVDIADDATNDWDEDEDGNKIVNHENIQRSKLRVEARLKAVEKLAPQKYGNKVQQQISGPNGGPIETKNTTAITGDLGSKSVDELTKLLADKLNG